MAGGKDVARREALSAVYLTPAEIETLGMVVNALGFAGSQLILRRNSTCTHMPICANSKASTKSC